MSSITFNDVYFMPHNDHRKPCGIFYYSTDAIVNELYYGENLEMAKKRLKLFYEKSRHRNLMNPHVIEHPVFIINDLDPNKLSDIILLKHNINTFLKMKKVLPDMKLLVFHEHNKFKKALNQVGYFNDNILQPIDTLTKKPYLLKRIIFSTETELNILSTEVEDVINQISMSVRTMTGKEVNKKVVFMDNKVKQYYEVHVDDTYKYAVTRQETIKETLQKIYHAETMVTEIQSDLSYLIFVNNLKHLILLKSKHNTLTEQNNAVKLIKKYHPSCTMKLHTITPNKNGVHIIKL